MSNTATRRVLTNMAYEISNYAVKATFVANEDLSNSQYAFVTIGYPMAGPINGGTTSFAPVDGGIVKAVNGPTGSPVILGVLQNAPRAGEEASVVLVGVTKLKSPLQSMAGEINVGTRVGLSAYGDGSGASNTTSTVGIALTAAKDGEIATVAISTPSAVEAASTTTGGIN